MPHKYVNAQVTQLSHVKVCNVLDKSLTCKISGELLRGTIEIISLQLKDKKNYF